MFIFYLRNFDVKRLNVQHGRTGSVFTQIQQHQILRIMSTQKSDHFSGLNLISYLKRVSLSARILHRAPPPPRLQVDQNFLTQKIVADPKMRCHQKSFGIWRVTEAILGQKTFFFS